MNSWRCLLVAPCQWVSGDSDRFTNVAADKRNRWPIQKRPFSKMEMDKESYEGRDKDTHTGKGKRHSRLHLTHLGPKGKGKRWRQLEPHEGLREERPSSRGWTIVECSSVQFSPSVMSDSFRPHEFQHARPPCPSPTPGVHSDSHPSSQWCHPAVSSSVVPFSSCPQSLPASESFPVSQLFEWGGQSTGVSALASFLPKKSQDWSPSEWTGWTSLQSKGLSRVFSNTTVQKHQFFGA